VDEKVEYLNKITPSFLASTFLKEREKEFTEDIG